MQREKELQQLIDSLEDYLHQKVKKNLHYSELSKIFKKLRRLDEEKFIEYIRRMPTHILGDILETFNERMLKESLNAISLKKMISTIKKMDSDDATDLLQDIEELDPSIAEEIMAGLDNKEQEEIQKLKGYEEDEAGSYMQTEVFSANHNDTIRETIENLRKLKYKDEVENITSVFIIGDYNNLVATVPLEDILLFDFDKTFKEIISKKVEKYKPRFVYDKENIEKVARDFKEYDLQVLPVVDENNYLVGRITADDIYDLLQEMATEQIYNMAGVHEETEKEKNIVEVIKKRGNWLFINLWTAILASFVIAQFEGTIKALPTLAVLMPIVASMGGNGGTQTLAVMVRQLALGEIDESNWNDQMKKEIIVATINGLLFAILVGGITYLWKGDLLMALVIGVAMIFNLIIAGISGGLIPIILKKFNIDPAVGSSVILTTVTDVVGFFAFLGLAQIFILN